jgi:CRP-like cAMP-binding protein
MTLTNSEDQTANRLLTFLPQEDQERLLQFLEPVVLDYKRPLYNADERIEFVHFIESGVGSLVCTMVDGQAAEVGTIGNEGLVGLPVVLGDERAPSSMYVQVPGRGLRMRAGAFREQLERSPRMRAALLRYTHVFFNHIALTAACAHFHSLEQRCCRWLLMTHDRMLSIPSC